MSDFAWTPVKPAYEHFPQYVNLTGARLTVRGPEFRNDDGHWQMGPTVSIDLPPEVLAELAASAGEAGTAETTKIGSAEGESAVPNEDSGDAQKGSA